MHALLSAPPFFENDLKMFSVLIGKHSFTNIVVCDCNTNDIRTKSMY